MEFKEIVKNSKWVELPKKIEVFFDKYGVYDAPFGADVCFNNVLVLWFFKESEIDYIDICRLFNIDEQCIDVTSPDTFNEYRIYLIDLYRVLEEK